MTHEEIRNRAAQFFDDSELAVLLESLADVVKAGDELCVKVEGSSFVKPLKLALLRVEALKPWQVSEGEDGI